MAAVKPQEAAPALCARAGPPAIVSHKPATINFTSTPHLHINNNFISFRGHVVSVTSLIVHCLFELQQWTPVLKWILRKAVRIVIVIISYKQKLGKLMFPGNSRGVHFYCFSVLPRVSRSPVEISSYFHNGTFLLKSSSFKFSGYLLQY